MFRKIADLRKANVPWALVVCMFINKSGDMAMSLLPMLLIDRSVSTGDAALILTSVKGAQVAGLFLGGILCDITGFRFVILLSFALSFAALTPLPFLHSHVAIAILAVAAQFGASLLGPSARALIRESKTFVVKTSIAWLRAASNLGQVVAALAGIAFGPLGLAIPYVFDGVTSGLALLIGSSKIQNPKVETEKDGKGWVSPGFYLFSFAMAMFYFTYELGFLSFSGFGKLALGDEGVRAFGIMLLINTLLCGTLAVPAARVFRHAKVDLPIGMILVGVGMFLMTALPKTFVCFAICSLIMSAGEIIFAVHAQALLLMNSHGKANKFYGISLFIQSLGRFAAGAALFPLVLTSSHPGLPFIAGTVGCLVLLLFLPKEFIKRAEEI